MFEAVQRGYLSQSAALGEIDESRHHFPYAVSAPAGKSGQELIGIGRGAATLRTS